MDKEELEWRTEEDVRTLGRARQIKKDPKRLKAAKKLAKEQMAEMAAVAEETKS